MKQRPLATPTWCSCYRPREQPSRGDHRTCACAVHAIRAPVTHSLALDAEYTILVYCRSKVRTGMNTTTVNIAFPKSLLREIDNVAQAESRSRSEFLREAARAYIQRKRRWANVFAMGKQIAEAKRLNPYDVSKEIKAYRRGKNPRS